MQDLPQPITVLQIANLSAEKRAELRVALLSKLESMFVGEEKVHISAFMLWVLRGTAYFKVPMVNKVSVELGRKLFAARMVNYPNLMQTYINYGQYSRRKDK